MRGRLAPAAHEIRRQTLPCKAGGAVFVSQIFRNDAIVVASLLCALRGCAAIGVVIELVGPGDVCSKIACRIGKPRLGFYRPQPLLLAEVICERNYSRFHLLRKHRRRLRCTGHRSGEQREQKQQRAGVWMTIIRILPNKNRHHVSARSECPITAIMTPSLLPAHIPGYAW